MLLGSVGDGMGGRINDKFVELSVGEVEGAFEFGDFRDKVFVVEVESRVDGRRRSRDSRKRRTQTFALGFGDNDRSGVNQIGFGTHWA